MKKYIDYLDSLSKKQLMVLLARQRQQQTDGIAIVGMGVRLPGGIDSPQSFWHALQEGRVVPAVDQGTPRFSNGEPRWNVAADDLADLSEQLPPARYLTDIDLFDAEYFGYQAEEADHMDPQQRLLLEVTVQALADANLPRAVIQKKAVGVFVSTSLVEYPLAGIRNGLKSSEVSPYLINGTSLGAASGRLGLMLGASGPAMTIDTASSSALVAVHQAIQSLRSRECDIAVVGASHLQLYPPTSALLSRAGILSSTGRSLPFSENADGFVRSEGCGVIILKRSRDIEDDLPYAVIRGSAIHQHGNRAGLSAASAMGQKWVIEQALENADVGPHEVQYVEAQANGSRIGAAVEAESIATAYDRLSPSAAPLYLGSCKANIGYLEIASGIASLIKVALALFHKEIPPQIGAENLDGNIGWRHMALKFAEKPVSWPGKNRALAGVSAFGVNGINSHVLMEGAAETANDQEAHCDKKVLDNGLTLLVLSATSCDNFTATATKLYGYLSQCEEWDPVSCCRTLMEGRELQKLRQSKVVSSRSEVLNTLSDWSKIPEQVLKNSLEKNAYVGLKVSAVNESTLRLCLSLLTEPGMMALKEKVDECLEQLALPPLQRLMSPDSVLPKELMLAWLLSWIELFSDVGMKIARLDVAGLETYKGVLASAIAGTQNRKALLDAWKENSALAASPLGEPSGWRIDSDDRVYRCKRIDCKRVHKTVNLEELDSYSWLSLIAERLNEGDYLELSALSLGKDRKLSRLPGPALVGKRYWPTHFEWH